MSRGFTLVEAAVAVGIAALAAVLLAPVVSVAARASSRANDPVHAALSTYASGLVRDAAQAWKYGAPANAVSQTYTATISAGAAASPLPVSVTETIAAVDAASSQVTVTVTSGSVTASASAQVAASAPLPGSQIARPGLVPMPSPPATP
ncbi:MAG TPA: hypothetical protein VFL13_06650 [Candidatus Baltobacteraceae bacterium]|nr:hypothetical protein [Candidatus Baltobacteraceae bacterium]